MMKGEEKKSSINFANFKIPPFSDELSIAGRSNLAEFVTDANEVVHFQLVRSEDDLEKAMAEAKPEAENGVTSKVKFNPEMTHQVFGEQ